MQYGGDAVLVIVLQMLFKVIFRLVTLEMASSRILFGIFFLKNSVNGFF